MINRAVVLINRPNGEPQLDDFQLVELPVSKPRKNQILLQTLWLSLDPYMRGLMDDRDSYTTGVKLGHPMRGETVSRVIESNYGDLVKGDLVVSYGRWQEYSAADGNRTRKIDPTLASPTTALGVLGMPGLTAYTGLLKIGQPKPGETIVVAAAAGPVGSLVGQIGKRLGCRVVGIAGTSEKCQYIVQLGFDVALNHHDPALRQALANACPDGVDIYFENVGGRVWEAAFPLLNRFARVPVCGLISQYSAVGVPAGPDRLPALFDNILSKRLTIRGFIIDDYYGTDVEDEFRQNVGSWVVKGEIKYKEDIKEGLELAPATFIAMLKGKNFGKTLVRVAV